MLLFLISFLIHEHFSEPLSTLHINNNQQQQQSGRAYSMNRLDQLAQPIRRNGEHVRSILERERRERELEMLDETASLGGGISGRRIIQSAAARGKRGGSASGGASGTSTAVGAMSRSMTHLAAGGGQRERGKYSLGGGISTSFRPLGNGQRDSSKSMTQISYSWSQIGTTNPHDKQQQQLQQRQSNLGLQTSATKKYLQSSFASSLNNASYATASANATRRAQQQYTTTTNPHNYNHHHNYHHHQRYLDLDPNSLLLMNSSSLLVNAGVCDQKKTKPTSKKQK